MSEELLVNFEKFVCKVYGKSKYGNVDKVRNIMLKVKRDGDINVSSI